MRSDFKVGDKVLVNYPNSPFEFFKVGELYEILQISGAAVSFKNHGYVANISMLLRPTPLIQALL
jgi:hypothetical protein